MKRLTVFAVFLVLTFMFHGCSKEEVDKEKDVLVTIYEHTGYGASVMSEVLTEPLLFSDSDDNEIRTLTDIITESFNFQKEYERGYRLTYKARKIWMNPSPEDASNIKYVATELVSKERVITEDSEEEMILFISSETVKFSPRYPNEIGEDGYPKVFDALHAKKEGTTKWMGIIKIEDFDYEEGFEYRIRVKEIIEAEPYTKRYGLVEILSKE